MLGRYDDRLAPLGVGLGTPRQAERRGSHLALLHPEGLALSRWLRAEAGVVADFRPPDTLRFAVSPLYTAYAEAWDAVEALATALESGAHRGFDPGGPEPPRRPIATGPHDRAAPVGADRDKARLRPPQG